MPVHYINTLEIARFSGMINAKAQIVSRLDANLLQEFSKLKQISFTDNDLQPLN